MALRCLDGSDFPIPIEQVPYTSIRPGEFLMWPQWYPDQAYQKLEAAGLLTGAFANPHREQGDQSDERAPCTKLDFEPRKLDGTPLPEWK